MFRNYFFDAVAQAVEEWIPKREYAKEDKYRDDLMRFLKERLPSEAYTVGKGAFLDIEINDDIGIELKRNLKAKTERNRLVGQVIDFLREHSYALVVLYGNVEQKTVNDLNKNFSRPKVKIISKNKSQILKEKNKRALLQRISKSSFSLIDYMKQTQKKEKKKRSMCDDVRDLKNHECRRCMEESGEFVKGKKLTIHMENFGNKFNTIYECPKGHKWSIPTASWHDISLSWLCPKCWEKKENFHGNELEVRVKGNIVEFDFQCPECGHKWTNRKELYRLM